MPPLYHSEVGYHDCAFPFFYSQLMQETGQASIASSIRSSGPTSGLITIAFSFSPSSLKTSGQISSQEPQPMQSSSLIITILFNKFLPFLLCTVDNLCASLSWLVHVLSDGKRGSQKFSDFVIHTGYMIIEKWPHFLNIQHPLFVQYPFLGFDIQNFSDKLGM
jgi:hypothetical protein